MRTSLLLNLGQQGNQCGCSTDRFDILMQVTIHDTAGAVRCDTAGNVFECRIFENGGCSSMPERVETERFHSAAFCSTDAQDLPDNAQMWSDFLHESGDKALVKNESGLKSFLRLTSWHP